MLVMGRKGLEVDGMGEMAHEDEIYKIRVYVDFFDSYYVSLIPYLLLLAMLLGFHFDLLVCLCFLYMTNVPPLHPLSFPSESLSFLPHRLYMYDLLFYSLSPAPTPTQLMLRENELRFFDFRLYYIITTSFHPFFSLPLSIIKRIQASPFISLFPIWHLLGPRALLQHTRFFIYCLDCLIVNTSTINNQKKKGNYY